jgi:hypothetical protein
MQMVRAAAGRGLEVAACLFSSLSTFFRSLNCISRAIHKGPIRPTPATTSLSARDFKGWHHGSRPQFLNHHPVASGWDIDMIQRVHISPDPSLVSSSISHSSISKTRWSQQGNIGSHPSERLQHSHGVYGRAHEIARTCTLSFQSPKRHAMLCFSQTRTRQKKIKIPKNAFFQ